MNQDFTQQQGLDSSILNPNFIGGGNRPIGRGKRINFKTRVLPFYGYYGANGEMIITSESAPMVTPQQEIIAPIVEQGLAPAQEYVAPAVEQTYTPRSQVLPLAVEQNTIAPIIEQSNAPAPTETNIPNAVIVEALPNPNFNQPTQQYSEPIVAETLPNPNFNQPVSQQYSEPIVAQTNTPSTPQTTTSSTTTTTTTSATKPTATTTSGGGVMPMGGGGGGGVASAPKPATTTTTTTVKAPNGVVQQKTTTTTFETKKGMSTGMKVGIVALLLVGGYLAYKNRTKLGF